MLILVVFAIAEVSLSPVGLSASTKLAPKPFGAQMVALFYLTIALGSAVAGQLSAYYSPDDEPAYFGILGAAGIVLGGVLLAFSKILRRLMHGVH